MSPWDAPRKSFFTPEEMDKITRSRSGSKGGRRKHENSDKKAAEYLKPPRKAKP